MTQVDRVNQLADRVFDEQFQEIKQRYGAQAAKDANYGWGQTTTRVETKVYVGLDKPNILVTTFDPKGPVTQPLKHRWSRHTHNE